MWLEKISKLPEKLYTNSGVNAQRCRRGRIPAAGNVWL